MHSYNSELVLLCDWYLRFCKVRDIDPNSITNIFLFFKKTTIEQYYHNYSEVVNDLMLEMVTRKL